MALDIYVGVARTSAVLPAAGAFDSSPTIIPWSNGNQITFFINYTRGGAAGAVTYKIEFSNDRTVWFQNSNTEIAAVVAGSNATNTTQRALNSYQATGASLEGFATQTFSEVAKYVRISLAESGNVGAPGTAYVEFAIRRDV